MTRPIYDLPQAKPMNARLWTGEVPSTPITPVGEVGNAATARDVSSAIASQPLTGMLIREDLRVPKEETTMASISTTPSDRASSSGKPHGSPTGASGRRRRSSRNSSRNCSSASDWYREHVGGKRLGDPGDDARGLSGFHTVSELPDTDELGPRIEIALGSRE